MQPHAHHCQLLIERLSCAVRGTRSCRSATKAAGALPPALAVINPKQPGDGYPDKNLAGVGIAYKIAEALMQKLDGQPANGNLTDLLDLVALGTVADLAPLLGLPCGERRQEKSVVGEEVGGLTDQAVDLAAFHARPPSVVR